MTNVILYLYIALMIFQLTLPMSQFLAWRFMWALVCFIVIMMDVHILIHNGDQQLLLLLSTIQITACIGVGMAYSHYGAKRTMPLYVVLGYIYSILSFVLSIWIVQNMN